MPDGFPNPPRPPRPFVGREADMNRLQDEIYRRERFPEMPVVITGEPGIGKTALAAEFVERQSRRERSIWIPSRDLEVLIEPFASVLRDRDQEFREAIVVLDGADEIPEDQFIRLFRNVINFKLVRRVLITSRKTPMAALGLRQEQIAKTVGVRSPKTLRKHFRRELQAGFAEATLGVMHVAYEMATSGRYPQMTIFWDKCRQTLSEELQEEGKQEKRARARSDAGGFVFLNAKETPNAT